MSINVGDQVHSPVWDSTHGFHVDCYTVLAKEQAELTLQHVETVYPNGSATSGSFATVKRPESDFAVPLIDRAREILADIQGLLDYFARPTHGT